MCRLYHSKQGNFVRVCYRGGLARGRHISYNGGEIKCPYNRIPVNRNYASKESVKRCIKCNAPLGRHDKLYCQLCLEGK